MSSGGVPESNDSPGAVASGTSSTRLTVRTDDTVGDQQCPQEPSCKYRKLEAPQKLCKDSELEKRVKDLAKNVIAAQGPALQDDQKRWLIIGICLHSIIAPALRKYVPPILQTVYASLKTSDNIDSQTFRHYLRRYRPTNKELNYEAINGNGTVQKVKGKNDSQKYDFRVQNCVDLSKLFLQTHMAHYTGFDDTCDTSALLALVINIDKFPQNLRTASKTVRDDVRNLWAHCNFSEWDNPRYQNSFLQMEHLIQCMKLQKQEEVDLLKLLATWKTNGSALLQGTIGFEVLTEVKKATSILAEYCKITGATADENFENIYRVLTNVCSNLECLKQIVYTMETDRKKYWEKLKSLQQKVDSLSSKEDSSNEIHHFYTPGRIKNICWP
ncbi:uncharacterized protein LOC123532002 isoform X1 [Mercenaria mercenaria]|uniref:uncharacterized protein LOC123532002 isoform X1 n=1 Tax=Mercenaria mercenaria TaxID=6596 RepID=UPI00234FA251|nr:uncharacterized protein LOC123532002 isoform X1 [Mercenaria mercenaria]